MKTKEIAVVICTHNRKRYLLEAVKSFSKIKKPKFNLIVIDSSEIKLAKKEKKGIDLYLYDKNKKALSIKRNLAIKKMPNKIIVFTDDDCIATENWLSGLVTLLNENVGCVTGRTIPFEGYEKTDYEEKFSFDRIGKKFRIIKKHFGLQNLWRFGHGNNMAFRRGVFKDVGLFDENLGVGSSGLRGEDVDMFYRIYKKGYPIVYNPNAVILHKHLTQKEDIPWASYANGYASRLVLFKNLDLNTSLLYAGGLLKLGIKVILSKGFKKEANLCLFKGWLGLKWKK